MDGSGPVGAPWSVRTPARPSRRPTLEIYEHGELLDVLVASALSGRLLRGARRQVREGRSTGLAWGRLAGDGSVPAVAFTAGRLRPRWRAAEVAVVGQEFWFAWTPDRLAGVQLRHPDGSTERLRPTRAH